MKVFILFLGLLVAPVAFSRPANAQNTLNLIKAPVIWPTIGRDFEEEYEPHVGAVQHLLRGRGFYKSKVDGIYGPKTVAAVKAFQKSRGLKADGILGPKSLPLLVITVKRGSRGDAVRAAQLLARGAVGHVGQQPYATLEADGIFGIETENAVKWAQAVENTFEDRLKKDGIVGPRTWCLLLGGKVVGSQV